jgi:hypothetical protein
MKKKEIQFSEPCTDEEAHLPDSLALRAILAVLEPRKNRDRSAALAMWRRIADTNLAEATFGVDEAQFIQTVASKMISSDKLDAKKRPDAVLAASGLYGTHRKESDTRIKQISEVLKNFEALPATTQIPSAVSKKYSKRNQSLAFFASDTDLMRNFPDVDMLRKSVNKVKDNSRKK